MNIYDNIYVRDNMFGSAFVLLYTFFVKITSWFFLWK